MVTPNNGSSRRRRGGSGGVWLLAAALGVTTVLFGATIIHEGGQRRSAAHVFARGVAAQVGTVARGRLESIALTKLAPVVALSRPAASSRASLVALVGAEREARRCECRDSIAAPAFFRWDASTNAVDVAVADSARWSNGVEQPLIAAAARADASHPLAERSPVVHLVANRALGDRAIVTLAARDADGRVPEVYGFFVDARDLVADLFAPPTGRDTTGALLRVDSTALLVETADSVQLFGNIDPSIGARATRSVGGSLDGLNIFVALQASQLPAAVRGPPRQQLWHLGMLMAATTIVIGLAARWSRRELMLARARSDFIAGVSHDLRMPLAQILLASETLASARVRDEPERLTLTSSILREARRLIGMVENILLFSQPGEVNESPRLDPVVVNELFEDVIEAVQLAVEDAGQRIDAAATPGLAVLGGRRSLCQALVNLVDNSLKYGKTGQTISLSAERHASGAVRLIVSDQGPGIPAADRARLFDPYQRLARDEGSERTGTGLGLAVVRRIVEQYKGRVWLEDAPGGGTRAVLELGAAPAPAPQSRQPEPV